MHKLISSILLITSVLVTVHALDLERRDTLVLEPRQNCVPCPANPPACPACPSGQECQIISQSCTQCAMSQCIPTSTLNDLPGNATAVPQKSNTGAIAGGIAGALVLVLAVVGIIFYWRRKKRVQSEELDAWLSTSGSTDEKSLCGSTSTRGTDANSLHHSIAETTMTRASNVIPIGYQPSPLRNTMMSSNTGISSISGPHDSLSTIPSHPPTQFFSADDILRASMASSNRDTRYTDRGTLYSNRDTQYTERNTMYSGRDSVATIGTTYTRASVATNYRATAIIATAPVPVQVRVQPKIVTFGKAQPPIPAMPQLTAEKVAEAERSRATIFASTVSATAATTTVSDVPTMSVPIQVKAVPVTARPASAAPVRLQTDTISASRLSAAPVVARPASTAPLSTPTTTSTPRLSAAPPAIRPASSAPLSILPTPSIQTRSITPTQITPATTVRPRLSRISTFDPLASRAISSPFDDIPDDMPESPILGEADSDSFLSSSKTPTPDSGAAPCHQFSEDIQIIVTPTSSISPSLLRDSVVGSIVSGR